ncbi:MAG: hypothetical protein ABIF11_06190 [Nitrospirota bacterium]
MTGKQFVEFYLPISRITTTMKRKDGKMIHIRKSCKAEVFHKKIYDALNLPSQPGKTIKVIL